MKTLAELAGEMTSGHSVTKPLMYYELYDKYFGHLANEKINILEVGVFEGESTKVFSRFFPQGSIVAIDLNIREIDFSACPNVRYIQCSQTDMPALDQLAREHFPDGIDIIIDDASHVGYYSQATFNALLPHLKAGGLYVIEDWGTGYWDGWPDGSRYQAFQTGPFNGQIPKRLPSHDYGMVGFIKSLVDLVGSPNFGTDQFSPVTHPQQIATLHFHLGVCIAVKAAPVV